MLKSYLFLFLTLSLISCAKSGPGNQAGAQLQQEEVSTLDSKSLTASSPVPNEALTFEINVKMVNFSREQEEKVFSAMDVIKQVVASEEFKRSILNHKYNGKRTFVDNGGLTNAQVYAKILEASEALFPKKNNTMDVELELYYEEANTIGYTFPNQNRIWMNTKYFDKFSAAQISDNMVHEWLHKIGFTHDYESTLSRPYSVPYAVGYLVKKLARAYL